MRRAVSRILFGALIALPLLAAAYVSPGAPTGFVSDFAGLLTPPDAAALESSLAVFARETRHEIAVVTVQTLGGDTIENYAEELFAEWGIGTKNADNGVLLLIVIADRAVRIEVGYGLEGALTDAQSSWIIQNDIIPAFRGERYAEGIRAGVDRIMAATRGEVVPSAEESRGAPSIPNLDYGWLIFIVPMWLASILARSKSWWAGGVLGGIAGVVIGLVKGFLYWGVGAVALLIPLGLLFDFLVSRAYTQGKATGHMPWWIGGRGPGGSGSGFGGGGFGGFGGGHSGGGGASGRW